MTNIAGMADDLPAQGLEPWRKKPTCANCPFAETDPDDGKLYCHEDSVKAQPVAIVHGAEQQRAVLAFPAKPQKAKLEVEVLGVTSYWPEAQPQWSCWRHPDRQAERRRLECGNGG